MVTSLSVQFSPTTYVVVVVYPPSPRVHYGAPQALHPSCEPGVKISMLPDQRCVLLVFVCLFVMVFITYLFIVVFFVVVEGAN
jgi:hypothetical protein